MPSFQVTIRDLKARTTDPLAPATGKQEADGSEGALTRHTSEPSNANRITVESSPHLRSIPRGCRYAKDIPTDSPGDGVRCQRRGTVRQKRHDAATNAAAGEVVGTANCVAR